MTFKSTATTLGLIAVSTAIGLLFSMQTIRAQSTPAPLSESATQSIQGQCSSIKTNLRQLHTTDALLRVNIGQTYDSLATSLMSRLNSRLVLNRLDGSELVDITSRFDTNHAAFRDAYKVYDDELRRLIGTDCEVTPELFYDRLQQTRQKRSDLNATIRALNDNIRDYSKAFEGFKRNFVQSSEANQ